MAREDRPLEELKTGADEIVGTLLAEGVEICFTNPGTSEMHFLAALDRRPGIRCVLGLAETVVTGAADGYARIAGKPAVTLLHTGPGLANGLANLHNARRGPAPIVNIIGDHATHHLAFDTPLASDVAGFAAPVSHWVHTVRENEHPGTAVATALDVARSGPGKIATLILPADLSWSPSSAPPLRLVSEAQSQVPDVRAAADALRQEGAMLLLGGNIDAELLEQAAAVAAATGARLAAETFPTRLAAGAGRARIEKLPYLPEMLHAVMSGVRHLVIAGAHRPATFFAYPDVRGDAVPSGCAVHVIAGPEDSIEGAIAALAAELGNASPALNAGQPPARPTGELNPFSLAQAVGATLPVDTILVEEAITGGMALFPILASAAPHDWLFQTGGAIGWGLPAAIGAAIAAPQRKVLCIEGDGSALYSIPALWTMARENLDITVLIIANRDYAILKHEYARVRADGMGPAVQSMMSIGNPDIDFVALAEGFGVRAVRVDTAEGLTAALEEAYASPGPRLVEALVPSPDLAGMFQ